MCGGQGGGCRRCGSAPVGTRPRQPAAHRKATGSRVLCLEPVYRPKGGKNPPGLAYMTFLHQAQTQETEQLQAMVESAVSNDAIKERTADRQKPSYASRMNDLAADPLRRSARQKYN